MGEVNKLNNNNIYIFLKCDIPVAFYTAGIVQLPTTVDAKGEDNSNPPNLAAPNYTV